MVAGTEVTAVTETKVKEDNVMTPNVEKLLVNQVFAQVEKPAGLIRTDVHHLWGDRYRVNCWCRGNNPALPMVGKISLSVFVSFREGSIRIFPD